MVAQPLRIQGWRCKNNHPVKLNVKSLTVRSHQRRRPELKPFYVTASSRGSGVAAALIADAEARLSDRGVGTAWLACAIGNDRAARFYEKSGWRRAGTMLHEAETSEGMFRLEVWRYEKSLTRGA